MRFFAFLSRKKAQEFVKFGCLNLYQRFNFGDNFYPAYFGAATREAVSKKGSEAVSSIVIKEVSEAVSSTVNKEVSEAVSSNVINYVSEAVSGIVIEKVSEAAFSKAKEVTGLLETEEAAVTSHETVAVTGGTFKGGQTLKIAKR